MKRLRKYKPFGDRLESTGTIDTDKLFTGQELDSTGLYYYGARYYDPSIGRFISADTIIPEPTNPQAFNRYSYVLNNPLKYVDPSGHNHNTPNGTVFGTVDMDNRTYFVYDQGGGTYVIYDPTQDASTAPISGLQGTIGLIASQQELNGDWGPGGSQGHAVVTIDVRVEYEGSTYSVPVHYAQGGSKAANAVRDFPGDVGGERGGLTIASGIFARASGLPEGGAYIRYQLGYYTSDTTLFGDTMHEAYHYIQQTNYPLGAEAEIGMYLSILVFTGYYNHPEEVRARNFAKDKVKNR